MPIDKNRYTHFAHFCYIPAYWNEQTFELAGRNWLFDALINYVGMPLQQSVNFVHSLLDPYYEPMFMLELGEEIEARDE